MRRPLMSRWLKSGRISIVCMAVMLVTTGCAGGSASQTHTGSRQVLATFSEFFIPTPGVAPADITQGPGKTLWFTEELGNKIGRITINGHITEFSIPTPHSHSFHMSVRCMVLYVCEQLD